jgi:hypothetical protein
MYGTYGKFTRKAKLPLILLLANQIDFGTLWCAMTAYSEIYILK